MGILNKITVTFQGSRKILQRTLEEYILLRSEAKQLTLKKKMVLLLCQQAESSTPGRKFGYGMGLYKGKLLAA